MNNDPVSWAEMSAYNTQDVHLLEGVYDKFKPWIKTYPNHALYVERNSVCCPSCGSAFYQKRGIAYTTAGKYQRYHCNSCGTWFRDFKNVTHIKVRQC